MCQCKQPSVPAGSEHEYETLLSELLAGNDESALGETKRTETGRAIQPRHPMPFRSTRIDRDEREFEDFMHSLQNNNGLMEEVPLLDEKAMKGTDNFPGTTLYVTLDLELTSPENRKYCSERVKGSCITYSKVESVRKTTALFFPERFDPAKPAHLLFYFHGHLKGTPGVTKYIKEYLNCPEKNGSLDIRQHIVGSGKNVILVAPTLGPISQAGNLLTKKGWDSFVTDVKDGIDEYIFKKRFPGQKIIPGKTILAAHSGGGKPMLKIAMHSGADEIWGFDSIYQGGNYSAKDKNHESWPNVAEKFPGAKLYFYFTKGDPYMNKAVQGVCAAKAKKPAAFSALKMINVSGEEHFSIIKKWMALRLSSLSAASDSFSNYQCEPVAVPVPTPAPSKKTERIPQPRELKEKRHAQKPSRTCRNREYETLLDEILGELSYEEEAADAGLAFRRKMAEIAETEWNVVWQSGALKENNPLVAAVMTEYYKEALNSSQASAAANAKAARQGTKPWSATFVSWVVRKTEESTGRKIGFTHATGHARYVGAARVAYRKKAGNSFQSFSPKKVKPETGDIICYSRKPGPHDTCGSACSHCDIVVAVHANEVHVIGGNTEDHFGGQGSSTVGKKKVALDANGFIADKKYTDVLKYILK